MCTDLSIGDFGEGVYSRDTVFLEIFKEGVGFKTGDFVKETLGGRTIERLENKKKGKR